MVAKLTEKCFKNMGGAYAALFTPYDGKGRVNPEMIEKIINYGIGTTYNIIPKHFAQICSLAAKGDLKRAAKWQDEANQVVELMIESDNWSYRKAMMKFIGLDCGWFRKPFEPLASAQYKAYAKRFAALKIVKKGAAL